MVSLPMTLITSKDYISNLKQRQGQYVEEYSTEVIHEANRNDRNFIYTIESRNQGRF